MLGTGKFQFRDDEPIEVDKRDNIQEIEELANIAGGMLPFNNKAGNK